MKKIVFLDLDGVLADFDSAILSGIKKDPPEMFVPGFFRNLNVMPGATQAVAKLISDSRYEIYVGSKPTYKNTLCATEKMDWVKEHFPYLKKRIVLVCHKKLLRGHVLIDDDLDRWGKSFKGKFIHFDKLNPERAWKDALKELGVE